MDIPYIGKTSLQNVMAVIKPDIEKKVDKIEGKALSTNDLTDELKTVYDKAVVKVAALEDIGAQPNVIETVKVNGKTLIVDEDKAVDVTVPTTEQIKTQIEAYGYQNSEDVETVITAKGYQTSENVKTIVESYQYQTEVNVKATIESYDYQTAADVQSRINDAIGDMSGIEIKVVGSLPELGVTGIIYLIADAHGENDNYDEYIWVATDSNYEKIGNTDVDLSQYTKTEDFKDFTKETKSHFSLLESSYADSIITLTGMINDKADKTEATAEAAGLMSAADKAGLDKLSAVNIVTVSSSGWSSSAPYTQTVAVSGMTAESVPVWGLYGTPTEAVYEAYCNITSMATTADAVTFACVSDKPESDVQIVIKGL